VNDDCPDTPNEQTDTKAFPIYAAICTWWAGELSREATSLASLQAFEREPTPLTRQKIDRLRAATLRMRALALDWEACEILAPNDDAVRAIKARYRDAGAEAEELTGKRAMQ
jgi:hypothetical protein